MVGTLASAAGCALGLRGAPLLAGLPVDEGMAPSWFTVRPVAWPLHAAFWTGLVVAFTGVWAASRRAGRIGPAEALREADVDTGVLPLGRRLLGFALLAGAAFLMAKSLVTDPSALLKRKTYTTQPMVLITAATLLTPLLVRPLARLVRLPERQHRRDPQLGRPPVAEPHPGCRAHRVLLMAGSVLSSELNALRLVSATRSRVLAVVAGETLFAVAIGALLGLAATAVNLAGLGAALASLSAPVTVSVQWPLVGGAAGVCAVVAVGAALLPGAVRCLSTPVH